MFGQFFFTWVREWLPNGKSLCLYLALKPLGFKALNRLELGLAGIKHGFCRVR